MYSKNLRINSTSGMIDVLALRGWRVLIIQIDDTVITRFVLYTHTRTSWTFLKEYKHQPDAVRSIRIDFKNRNQIFSIELGGLIL